MRKAREKKGRKKVPRNKAVNILGGEQQSLERDSKKKKRRRTEGKGGEGGQGRIFVIARGFRASQFAFAHAKLRRMNKGKTALSRGGEKGSQPAGLSTIARCLGPYNIEEETSE